MCELRSNKAHYNVITFSTGGAVKSNFTEGLGLQNPDAVDEAVRR